MTLLFGAGDLGAVFPSGKFESEEVSFDISFKYDFCAFSVSNGADKVFSGTGSFFKYVSSFSHDLGVVYKENGKPLFRVANGSKLEKGQYCISEDGEPKCIFSKDDDGEVVLIRYDKIKNEGKDFKGDLNTIIDNHIKVLKRKRDIKDSITTILSKTAIIDNQRVCVVLNDSRRFDTFNDYLEEVIEIINKEYTDFNDAHAELMPCKMLDLPFYKISNSTIRFKNGSTIKLVDKDRWQDLIGVRFDNAFISSNIKYGYKDKDNLAFCLDMCIYDGGNKDGCVRTLDGI